MSRISIEHVRLTVDRPFDAFRAAFEGQLGHFHPSAYEALEHGDPQAARARLESMTGPSGFMLFRTSDHGAVLRLVGKPRKAMQYLLGNPLIAVEMTRHAIGAALYAPLRVLLYEDGGRKDLRGIRPPVVALRTIRGRARRSGGRVAGPETGGLDRGGVGMRQVGTSTNASPFAEYRLRERQGRATGKRMRKSLPRTAINLALQRTRPAAGDSVLS